jgi:hypothetical protein
MRHATLIELLRRARFDRIELVGLGAGEVRFEVGLEERPFAVAWTRVLDEDARREVEALVRAMPAGTPEQCHIPPFGLRFGAPPDDTRMTLCFECSNAYVDGELGAFEATSPEATSLLALLRRLAPVELA